MSDVLIQVCALFWISSLVEGKTPDILHVTCIYSMDCILPCSFTPAGSKDIEWYKQEVLLHSFIQGQDKPGNSSTSLFMEEVTYGNASLLLRQCSIKSRGRYKCRITSTGSKQDLNVFVKVEAPIQTVSIETQLSVEVQCRSHGVYPAPVVQWSVEPRSAITALSPHTRMKADSNGLYSVESMLMTLNRSSHVTYICTMASKYGSKTWRASLLQTDINGKEGHTLIIPCAAPRNLKNFTLSWTFTKRNKKPTTILTNDCQSHNTSYYWKNTAELDQEKVLIGDGSLQLLNPQSSEHSGAYTCKFLGSQTTHLVQTQVNIESASSRNSQKNNENQHSWLWLIAVILAVLALIPVSLLIRKKCQGGAKSSAQASQEDAELQPMHTVRGSSM